MVEEICRDPCHRVGERRITHPTQSSSVDGLIVASQHDGAGLTARSFPKGESFLHSLCVEANLRMSTIVPGQFSILVVEGESSARESLAELFRFDGHRAHEAGDSNTAIVHLRNDPMIKVILLDVQMPSWRMVAKHARSNRAASIIVGMGTMDNSRIVLEVQDLDDYLLKPLSYDYVCECIAYLLQRRRS